MCRPLAGLCTCPRGGFHQGDESMGVAVGALFSSALGPQPPRVVQAVKLERPSGVSTWRSAPCQSVRASDAPMTESRSTRSSMEPLQVGRLRWSGLYQPFLSIPHQQRRAPQRPYVKIPSLMFAVPALPTTLALLSPHTLGPAVGPKTSVATATEFVKPQAAGIEQLSMRTAWEASLRSHRSTTTCPHPPLIVERTL